MHNHAIWKQAISLLPLSFASSSFCFLMAMTTSGDRGVLTHTSTRKCALPTSNGVAIDFFFRWIASNGQKMTTPVNLSLPQKVQEGGNWKSPKLWNSGSLYLPKACIMPKYTLQTSQDPQPDATKEKAREFLEWSKDPIRVSDVRQRPLEGQSSTWCLPSQLSTLLPVSFS